MGEPFDPYRDALVVEEKTLWPNEFSELSAEEKGRIESRLHRDAAKAAELAYIRLHAGFCRQITVTEGDIQRFREAS